MDKMNILVLFSMTSDNLFIEAVQIILFLTTIRTKLRNRKTTLDVF